jgi:hypothetical protein
MSSKAELVPIAVVEYLHAPSGAATRPRRRTIGPAAIASLAALLVGACSSKNQDSLPGVNVDENLAMMNAEKSVNSNLDMRNESESNSGSRDHSGSYVELSAEPAASKANTVENSKERPPKFDPAITELRGASDENQSSPNQVDESEDQPPNPR